eukprot:CAMPEP_0172483806 /NCGR_PEP_ID=MMETSP1066-20121228/10978_1 /TAXON_ID=671091 /ORGANISM="Coscinodiscus wailesii, Strain CCMP2513" /LENGTH=53 /DNA_ID=CAMNT_0013247927 /DNA_START=239 /DNA_END=397 /DNA_ORIENTATION=+
MTTTTTNSHATMETPRHRGEEPTWVESADNDTVWSVSTSRGCDISVQGTSNWG